jgi:4-amino-4-deoxy-L-arabinose transferase-like glycosyltransferase
MSSAHVGHALVPGHSDRVPSRGPLIVALIASAVVWGTGVFGPYGWFADELYFLTCAESPALGYVDHPPLATLLLAVLRVVFDDQLPLIRLVPTIAYGVAIVQMGRLARAQGGGAFAQTLAAAIFATAPAVLVIAGFYSMNPFELLLLIILARIALSLAQGADPRLWLWFGAVTGVALLNKHAALLPAGLLAAAVLFGPARAQLATRWPYLGAALAFVIFLPNLVWLVLHDGVTLEFYRLSVPAKNIEQTPLESLVGQAMFVGPMVFLIAVLGAISLLRQPGRRGFGVMFVIALVVMMTSGISRADRILAVYPLLFAAGTCALERITRGRIAHRIVVVAMIAVGAAPPLPLVLPVLPPTLLIQYSTALAVTPQLEVAKRGAMPQWLGDKRGWPEVVEATAEVYRTLPEVDRQHTVIFAADYGTAGALALFWPEAPVISTHNELWARGPGSAAGSNILAVGHDLAYWQRLYAEVTRAGTVRCTGCLIDGMPIWLARGDAPGLAARWPALRRFE